MAVKIGDRFRSHYADANALWEVTDKQGRDMWRAVIVDDEDYAGVVRGFTTDSIEDAKAWAQSFETIMDEHERYFANLAIGSIVHYDNGFGQFVRCVRVVGVEGKRLQPTALVGNWDAYDLPRRNVDGTVHLGYHAEKILNQDAFEPNVSNIWEAKDAKARAWSMRGLAPSAQDVLNDVGKARFAQKRHQAPFDPTVEPAIDLSVPPLDGEAAKVAALAQRVNEVRALLDEDVNPTVEGYRYLLAQVAQAAQD